MKLVVAQWSLILLCFSMAVAWDYVLGVKRVIWPLSIFASAERLSSDEKSSIGSISNLRQGLKQYAAPDGTEPTNTRKRGPLSLFLLRHLIQNERVRDESVAAANGKAAEMAAHF